MRSMRRRDNPRRASIALVAAAVIATLATMAGVSIDLGSAYLAKVADQRAADSAAYAGGLAYNAANSANAMKSAARSLATLNGLPEESIASVMGASPTGDGNSAVQVTVTTSVPMYMAKIIRSDAKLSVSATAYAEVRPNAPACIIALQPGSSGVTLSGGTAVDAPGCTVASNSTVSVPCGTSIVTKTLDYNAAAAPSQPCGGVQPPNGTSAVNIVKATTANPLSGNEAVAGAFEHLASVAELSGPPEPETTSGTDIAFGYNPGATQSQLSAAGCSGTFASQTWTVSCPPGGTYKFGALSVAGGINLQFAPGGSASNTYQFSGALALTGSAANFGPGTYTVAGGIVTGGGTTTTFSTGSYTVGDGTLGCNGAYYSICNTGSSLSFGAANFAISGGIYNGGGAALSLGAGSSANSFAIGAGSSGYAIQASGGSNTSFGGMSAGTFQVAGQIASGGGSTLAFGAAPAFDINGNFNLAGSATLGAGTYSVAGNIAFGNGGGGGSVSGTGVSLIVADAFSVAAGYNSVTLTSPASGPLQNIAVAGNGPAGASFSQGASGNSLSGALYFPNAPISLSGAGNVGNGPGQCLEAIGATVTLSGGSALASTCPGLGGTASGGTVVLVQ